MEAPYGEGRCLREGPVLTGSPLTGALTGRPPYGKAPYGEASYGKAPYELQESLRECTVAVNQKRPFFLRAGPFLAFLPFKDAYGKAGPLREALRGGTVLTGRAPLRRGTVLTGRAPLRGVPYGDGSLYKKGRLNGKLRGEPLPELGGNFRLCAVDQKRPFFLRAGPFLAFLPFKEAYGKAGPLREVLAGRDGPYGKGPLTERDGPYGKGPLTGSPLRGWLPLQKRTAYGKLRGEFLSELGRNFRLCAVDQKRPFFLRAGPFLAFLPF